MALEFSTEVRQAATVFTEYRNSIDIYTEDCDKDKEFYRYTKKLLGEKCQMRITNEDEKTRTVTAEDDYLGKVLSVIEIIGLGHNLSIVKEK